MSYSIPSSSPDFSASVICGNSTTYVRAGFPVNLALLLEPVAANTFLGGLPRLCPRRAFELRAEIAKLSTSGGKAVVDESPLVREATSESPLVREALSELQAMCRAAGKSPPVSEALSESLA